MQFDWIERSATPACVLRRPVTVYLCHSHFSHLLYLLGDIHIRAGEIFFVSPSSRMRWEAASDCVSQNVSRCQPCLPCSCVCICGMSLLCGSINGQEYIGNYTRHHIEHIWIIRESNNYSWIASVCCAKPQENMSAKCMTQRSLTFDIWEIRRPDKRLCISYDLELLPASKLEVGLD